jgi:hypothetical protein
VCDHVLSGLAYKGCPWCLHSKEQVDNAREIFPSLFSFARALSPFSTFLSFFFSFHAQSIFVDLKNHQEQNGKKIFSRPWFEPLKMSSSFNLLVTPLIYKIV